MLETAVRGEADRVVYLLAVSGERLVTLAPAAARSQRRFGGALLPGARVKVRWRRTRESGPRVLEEATLLDPPPRPDPLEHYYTVAHLLELASAFAREGNEDPRLYRLLRRLLALAGGPQIAELARYAEAWLLRLSGLLAEPTECGGCGRTLAGEAVHAEAGGAFFCETHAPATAERLPARAAGWLALSRWTPPEELPRLGPADHERLGRFLRRMIVAFTERPLRAYEGLERLRASGGAGREGR